MHHVRVQRHLAVRDLLSALQMTGWTGVGATAEHGVMRTFMQCAQVATAVLVVVFAVYVARWFTTPVD